MKIGNWLITNESIEWKGTGKNTFVIPIKEITEKIETDDDKLSFYKWIMLATDEEWLGDDELYDLNFAFVYAVAKSGAEFDYQVFDETLSYQYSQLDDEDEE
ncbi:MAG: hypothetical protein EOO02_03075 [Chitinophagaceae bacterium]|nr:MAG: hypothetical protein EOO02_03075 [Chitinophagaceae bacterium]